MAARKSTSKSKTKTKATQTKLGEAKSSREWLKQPRFSFDKSSYRYKKGDDYTGGWEYAADKVPTVNVEVRTLKLIMKRKDGAISYGDFAAFRTDLLVCVLEPGKGVPAIWTKTDVEYVAPLPTPHPFYVDIQATNEAIDAEMKRLEAWVDAAGFEMPVYELKANRTVSKSLQSRLEGIGLKKK